METEETAERLRSLKIAKLEQDADTPSLGRSADLARSGRRAFQADVNPELQHSACRNTLARSEVMVSGDL